MSKPILVTIVALLLSGCGSSAPYRAVATVDVGSNPHGIIFSDDGSLAYVACTGDGRIDVIDCETYEVVDSHQTRGAPLDMVPCSAEEWIVTQYRSDELVLASREQGRMAQWVVGQGGSLFAPRVVNDKAVFSCNLANRLVVFDLERREVVHRHDTGRGPGPPDVTKDGRVAFVPQIEDWNVRAIDLQTGQTRSVIGVGVQPRSGALTPDDAHYICVVSGADSIVFIDASDDTIVETIDEGIGRRPFSIVVSADGRYALVGTLVGRLVTVIDVEQRKVLGTVTAGEQPVVLRNHPDGNRIFVANEDSNTVTVLAPR
jgi:DNA-binding beta-propeller fold protein YncE